MAYTDNFPQRPVFMADFANGGRIDPRATFTRASTANVWDGSKHLSSENLLLQSSDFDTTWSKQGLATPTGGQSDPAGGTDGFTLVEDSASTFHRVFQQISTSGELALTVYAKQNSGTRYLNLTIASDTASDEAGLATFDLAGGATHTSNGASSSLTSLSATQTASGNGYYKCVFKATATTTTAVTISLGDSAAPVSNNYGLDLYTGDGSSSIDVAFASLSTTGATDYNATTTQIHREYAPSLVSKANNVGRFDHTTDGQSMGILIEGQSTNLLNYSEQFDNGYWTKSDATVAASAAVAPSGELTADLATVDSTGSATTHSIERLYTFTSGTTYTFSVYAKAAGLTKFALRGGSTTTWAAETIFTLTGDGSVSVSIGSARIEPCGNGWYRCSVTGTAGASSATKLLMSFLDSGGNYSFDGDDYSGVLLWGAQMETGAASSYLKADGSTVTRAAESLSMDLTQAGFNGGPVTIVSETEGGVGYYPKAWTLSDGTSANRVQVRRTSSAATTSDNWTVYATSSGVDNVAATFNGSASAGKLAVSWDTDDFSFTSLGNTVQQDTAAALPANATTLNIGALNGGSDQLNGTVKRIAVYGEALSDTNLQALTS
jgi:hypothetical protein